MRNNQPVNQSEYHVPKGLTLVSKTDLKGTIIECNDAFEDASGFSRSELLGQPHNMIRHPDVPEVVFKDMWRDLKKGIPWSQIVKNRRKDGGYYWVRANVSPIFEENSIIGYMSVRTKVSEEEKKEAERAYKKLNNGHLRIKHGVIRSNHSYLTDLYHHFGSNISLLFLAIVPLPTLAVNFLELDSQNNRYTLLAILLLLIGLSFFYVRYLRVENNKQIINLRKLAEGKGLDFGSYNPNSFFGKLHSAILTANQSFLEKNEEVTYQLDKARQLELAVNKVRSNIMMADSDYNITFINEALESFLLEREEVFKNEFRHFDVKNIIGTNIDVFHKHPEYNRKILDELTEPFSTEMQIADCHFCLHIMPLTNRVGKTCGMLVEWEDVTEEKQLLESVDAAIKKAQLGYLAHRIDLSKVSGTAKKLSSSINDLMESIEEAINDISLVTTGMSEGDLTRNITGSYEGDLGDLRDSINDSVLKLRSIVSKAVESCDVVYKVSEEVSQGSMSLNDRVQQQAAAVEETSATMEQMNESVKRNAQNITLVNSMAITIRENTNESFQTMSNTLEAMKAIQDSSQKISEIVNLIDGVAFQTNLLALNAAVEAARAGEHGRGFAVVAGEVRELAQKSATAAKDISDLITETVMRVNNGVKLAQESGEKLEVITKDIGLISEKIEEINNATGEQAQSINQVDSAIANIDSTTQQNSALVEETAASTEALRYQAQSLQRELSFFIANEK